MPPVWGVLPRVAYLSSLCVCACVWRGGGDALGGGWAGKVCPLLSVRCPAGVALGGGWAEKVCPLLSVVVRCCCPLLLSGRGGLLGGGDFRGEFRVTGHAGKRSPERDLRIGMFRTSHSMFFTSKMHAGVHGRASMRRVI